ncbi:hypothetical protein CN931_25165 [Bacillus sp. AFS054943]|uniref:Type IV secretion system protein n=1 Tax=Bacillus cereus TaxID=1396 RepID=A0A2C1LLY4_BACCE|nr:MULTISPECIES: hypothetical protein [Bacillus]PGL77245.1 hypothetical protein CN931_25165 [Bacillus sp. AFS054943]PGT99486.1 hypothetical protein COD19_19405 [Bacillus cereus]
MDSLISKLMGFFAEVLIMILNAIMKPIVGELDSVTALIFGVQKDGDKYVPYEFYKTFTSNQIDALTSVLNSSMLIAGLTTVVLIILQGTKMASASINPANRTAAIELMKDLLIVGFLLISLGKVYSIIFEANSMLVDIFQNSILNKFPQLAEGDKLYGWNALQEAGDGKDFEAFSKLFYLFVQFILSIWANLYYFMRKVSLFILLGLGPVMISFWLRPQFKPILMGYFKELIGLTLIPAVHAFTYFIILILAGDFAEDKVLQKLFFLIIFIPMGEFVRKLLGLGGDLSGGFMKAGTMLGFSTMAGMYGAFQGVRNRNSKGSSSKGSKDNKNGTSTNGEDVDNPKTGSILANEGTDMGSSLAAARMMKAGEIGSKMGRAYFGMAGALGGAAVGPQGAFVGGAIAGEMGDKIGGLAGRGVYAGVAPVAGHLKDSFKSGLDRYNDLKGQNQLNEEEMVEDIATRDYSAWKNAVDEHGNETNSDASLKNSFREQFPNATEEQIDKMVQSANSTKMDESRGSALRQLSTWQKDGGKYSSANDLVSNARDSFVNSYATEENKEAYMNGLDSNMTEAEKIASWNEHVEGKANEFESVAKQAAVDSGAVNLNSKSKGGTSLFEKSMVDKNEFANNLGQGLSESNGFSTLSDNVKQSISNDVQQTAGESLVSDNGMLNRNALAALTTQKYMSGISEQAEQPTEQSIQTIYDSAANSVPTPQNVFDASTMKAIGGGVATGVATAVGVKSLNNLTDVARSAKATQDSIRIQGGTVLEQVQGVANDVRENTLGSNTEAHHAWTKGVAYAGGVLTGGAGYRAMSKVANRVSPFKGKMENEIKEINEIHQMVPTITNEKGQTNVKQGNVRMVTTQDRSWIEATDSAGVSHVVSRHGSGDSNMRKGTVVYQDLDIQNGSFVPFRMDGKKSAAYMEDTSGGKVMLDRNINVNPNMLVSAGRNVQAGQVTKLPTTLNSKVEQGKYYINDAESQGIQDIKMIVERGRSYMVGKTANGLTQRISGIVQGDTRLGVGERVERSCDIVNGRLKVMNDNLVTQENSMKVDSQKYNLSDFNPNDLLKQTPNPRMSYRKRIEDMRQDHEENGMGLSS